MKMITTFPQTSEFEKARTRLDTLSLPYDVILPEPGYALVGTPALVVEMETRMALAQKGINDFVCSGWVDYRPASSEVPKQEPLKFEEDVFGNSAIMVLAPCVADATKVRLIAHISGNLTEAFPYLNTDMREGCYNANGPNFTFMDGYRMVSLYPRRVTVAKADEIVDAWRTLEGIRCRVNKVWSRQAEIEPSYQMRKRPPALEIFKRLPGTNCRVCGEPTCLAFAVKVHSGELPVSLCKPVFEGEFVHLKDALMEICSGLGVV